MCVIRVIWRQRRQQVVVRRDLLLEVWNHHLVWKVHIPQWSHRSWRHKCREEQDTRWWVTDGHFGKLVKIHGHFWCFTGSFLMFSLHVELCGLVTRLPGILATWKSKHWAASSGHFYVKSKKWGERFGWLLLICFSVDLIIVDKLQ